MEVSQFLPAFEPFQLPGTTLSSPAPLCLPMPMAIPLTHLHCTPVHQGCATELLAPTLCPCCFPRLLEALGDSRKLVNYLQTVKLFNCPFSTDDIKYFPAFVGAGKWLQAAVKGRPQCEPGPPAQVWFLLV